MRTATKGVCLGGVIALVGVLASVIPPAYRLETRFGLDWLFKLRGPRPAPSEIVIVSIDHSSFRRLGAPIRTNKWPRSEHGRLVEMLTEQGADVIAFDVIFDQAQDREQDRSFAEAIRKTGNVVLFQNLKKETISLPPQAATETQAIAQRLTNPIAELAESAVGLAPFPLPKTPANVSLTWTFKSGAGDAPTLPVVALLHMAMSRSDDIRALVLETIDDGKDEYRHATIGSEKIQVQTIAKRLRHEFQDDPQLAERLRTRFPDIDGPERSLLNALVDVFAGDNERYLDFYGPPKTITTIPHHKLFDEGATGPIDFTDKIVFVGFSEQLDPKDAFYTSFSRADGVGTSGIEIMATAFGNLLEQKSIEPLQPLSSLAIIIAWGMGIGMLFMLIPGVRLVLIAIALGGAYLWGAYLSFAHAGAWPPLVAPLVWQLPLALLVGLSWHFREARLEREQIREAIRFYVPNWVVDEMVKGRREITAQKQNQYGVCLATDAEQYSALSEQLRPAELHSVLNQYYQTLFTPVTRRDGVISDVIGDAMMAIWTTDKPQRSVRLNACLAALEIITDVEGIKLPVSAELPTRLGLHCGEMSIGSVGAGSHYEFRAVGDVVNSSERIERLSKRLGTRLLASNEVVDGLREIATREVGAFRLPGKRNPLRIYEIMCRREMLDSDMRNLRTLFYSGLRLFRSREWRQAAAAFEQSLNRHADDGPSRYYLDLCRHYASSPPSLSWDGVVNLDSK